MFWSWLFSFWHDTTTPVGSVGDAHRRVGGVDALAAGTAGAVDVDAQVVGVDLDVDLLRLGVDEHPGGRGVDAPLRLGRGHPLHPVHAALELQPPPGAVAPLDGDRDVFVSAQVGVLRVDDLGLVAGPLGEAQVHAQEVAGEEHGLLAALARLDLHDDVFVVVGVAGHQQVAQPFLQRGDAGLELGRLVGERRVFTGEFARGLDVVAHLAEFPVGADDRRELGVTLPELPGLRLVGVHGRIGELRARDLRIR